jgi:hypothetical protein
VFLNLDEWLFYKTVTNLYEKKIGVQELLYQEQVKYIFIRFYDKQNRNQNMIEKTLKSLFKMNTSIINKIYKCQMLNKAHSSYNDNWLLSIGAKRDRQPANQNTSKKTKASLLTNKEQFFDSSYAGVETLIAVPSSNPGVAGTINPFIEIDDYGCIVQPEWTKSLDGLRPYILHINIPDLS